MKDEYIVRRDPNRPNVYHVIRRHKNSTEEIIETCYVKGEAERIAKVLNKVLKQLREEMEELLKDQKKSRE